MEIQSSTSENKFKKFLSSDLFFISCHLVIIILIFSPFLFSNQMLYSSDQMGGLDSKFFLKNSLEHFHQLPMWFSSRLGGMPSIDAMFGDPFYFPSIFFNSLLPIHKSIGIKMIFHLFLSGEDLKSTLSLHLLVVCFTCLTHNFFRISILVMTERCMSSPGFHL
jgi:hypothetical protein